MKSLITIVAFFIVNNIGAQQNLDNLFAESSIVLKTVSGHIYGTLTLPNTNSILPVALIVAGSGPTDRNCNNPTMKNDAYKKLAHELALRNIASVRFDKRGVAESSLAGKSEADLRFEHYVEDVKEWIQLLKKDQRFGRITVIGHSEGSLIGMLAASQADQFVSLAGVGQGFQKILKTQLKAQSDELLAMSSPIIDSLAKGKLVDHVNPMLYQLFRPSVQPYLISWFRYDPQIEIKRLQKPILIVQGTNDIQVSKNDAHLLSEANKNSKLVIIENMNHIFRTVKGDRMANIGTYNNPMLPLAPGFVDEISNFILNLK